MQAGLYRGVGDIGVVERNMPEPSAGWVRLRVTSAGDDRRNPLNDRGCRRFLRRSEVPVPFLTRQKPLVNEVNLPWYCAGSKP